MSKVAVINKGIWNAKKPMIKQIIYLSFEANRDPLSESRRLEHTDVYSVDGIAPIAGIATGVAIRRAKQIGCCIVIVNPAYRALRNRSWSRRRKVNQSAIGHPLIRALPD